MAWNPEPRGPRVGLHNGNARTSSPSRANVLAVRRRPEARRFPYSPVRLWVEMTNACNLKCVMCPTSPSVGLEAE